MPTIDPSTIDKTEARALYAATLAISREAGTFVRLKADVRTLQALQAMGRARLTEHARRFDPVDPPRWEEDLDFEVLGPSPSRDGPRLGGPALAGGGARPPVPAPRRTGSGPRPGGRARRRPRAPAAGEMKMMSASVPELVRAALERAGRPLAVAEVRAALPGVPALAIGNALHRLVRRGVAVAAGPKGRQTYLVRADSAARHLLHARYTRQETAGPQRDGE